MPRRSKEISQILKGLTPEELALLKAILNKGATGGAEVFKSTVEYLKDIVYDFVPVSMAEFLSDPMYLGRISSSLYPRLRQDLIEIFDGNKYNVIILTGSIGWGKTTTATISTVRIVYELSCFKNPPSALGLMETAPVDIVLVCPQKDTALRTIFDTVASMLLSVPFFKERLNIKIDAQDGIIEITNKRIRILARSADDSSLLGLNIIAAVIDEANFYGGVGARRVNTIYNMIALRMHSRYLDKISFPGKLFLISSAAYVHSFVEKKIEELKDDDKTFIRRYSIWEVKEGYYSDEKFPVFVGTLTLPPKVLSEFEVEFYQKNYEHHPPVGPKVIWVPVDFKKDFEQDIYMALRDIAGYSIASSNPFWQGDISKIYECVVDEKNPLPGRYVLRHPFSSEVYEYGRDFYIEPEKVCRLNESGQWVPIVNPNAARFVHVDLGVKSDACGIAMGHVAYYDEGKLYYSPVIYIDFMLRIVPPRDGEILIEDVQNLILKFYDLGFNIVKITFDKFQSLESLQRFKRLNIEASWLSVETIDKYKLLKDLIYSRRIRFYFYEPFITEFLNLTYDGNYVVHPPKGSKDVSDAVCGVVNSIYIYAEKVGVSNFSPVDYIATARAVKKANLEKKALFEAFGIAYSEKNKMDVVDLYLEKIANK